MALPDSKRITGLFYPEWHCAVCRNWESVNNSHLILFLTVFFKENSTVTLNGSRSCRIQESRFYKKFSLFYRKLRPDTSTHSLLLLRLEQLFPKPKEGV